MHVVILKLGNQELPCFVHHNQEETDSYVNRLADEMRQYGVFATVCDEGYMLTYREKALGTITRNSQRNNHDIVNLHLNNIIRPIFVNFGSLIIFDLLVNNSLSINNGDDK